jgi:hypothetical protein
MAQVRPVAGTTLSRSRKSPWVLRPQRRHRPRRLGKGAAASQITVAKTGLALTPKTLPPPNSRPLPGDVDTPSILPSALRSNHPIWPAGCNPADDVSGSRYRAVPSCPSPELTGMTRFPPNHRERVVRKRGAAATAQTRKRREKQKTSSWITSLVNRRPSAVNRITRRRPQCSCKRSGATRTSSSFGLGVFETAPGRSGFGERITALPTKPTRSHSEGATPAGCTARS